MGDSTGIEWTDAARERFWSRVRKASPDACWPWTAGLFSNGYGQLRHGERKLRAHRVAYELANGPIGNLCVLHRCDNRPCCNPAHLFLGTNADNVADREAKGRGRATPPPGRAGELNPSAKIDRTTAAVVRALRENGLSLRAIAENVGISPSQVRNIVNGRCWT